MVKFQDYINSLGLKDTIMELDSWIEKQISYAYDDQNRVTEITQGGQKTKVSYQVNSDGSTTTSVTDANGHVKQETASASGSVTTTSDLGDGSESITTKYTYDDRGNKLSEVYANGAKKTYEYNNRNLVTKTQSYDKEGTKTLTSRYRYDDKGQLSEMTDYSVSSETETAYRYTEYSYDTRGRITTFAEISQNAQPTADDIKAHQIRYTYNENGNLSKVSYPTTKDGIQSLSYIYDENGIDLAVVKQIKEVERVRIKEYAERVPGSEYHEGCKNIWTVPCDIAMPCASQNEMDLEGAKAVIKNGAMAVFEGANMPLTPEAINAVIEAGLLYTPGKASNAGGVATSGLEMSQNSLRMSWSFEEVDEKLHGIMKSIFKACYDASVECGQPGNMMLGANVAGFLKVANAMMAQGIV